GLLLLRAGAVAGDGQRLRELEVDLGVVGAAGRGLAQAQRGRGGVARLELELSQLALDRERVAWIGGRAQVEASGAGEVAGGARNGRHARLAVERAGAGVGEARVAALAQRLGRAGELLARARVAAARHRLVELEARLHVARVQAGGLFELRLRLGRVLEREV